MNQDNAVAEALERLAALATPGPWCGYSEPEVGLPYGLFAGIVGQSGFLQMEPLTPLDIDLIVVLRNNLPALIEAVKALEPFAKAAMGVEIFDPDFPMDGAALRASFDWYDCANSEGLRRHSVCRSDLERARRAFDALKAQRVDEGGVS